MSSSPPSQAELYTKMLIAVMDFSAFLVVVGIHILPQYPEVPAWIFGVLLSILGTMLGVDIMRSVREEAR